MSTTTIRNMATAGVEGLSFGITDFAVVGFMLAASMAIGIYFGFFSKSKNTTEEYLRGGKKLQSLPIAISLVASQLSGIAIMSVPAENYAYGFNFIFVVLSMIVALPIIIYVIVPVFYENNVANCYEYLEMRFNKRTRQLVTATFILNQFLMLPVYMFVPSLAFSQVTGINIHLINAIVSSICILYTTMGGIKAVVWTDVVQGSIMFASVVLVSVLGTLRIGGLSKVIEHASEGGRFNFEFGLDPRLRVSLYGGFTSGLIIWTGKVSLDQTCVQRIVSLPSYSHAKKALVIAGVGFLFIMCLNCFTGIIMFARYYGCDPMLAGLVSKPDKMMPFFVQDIVGHLSGMPGVFIACVFSASLSTLSAHLNSLAGVVYFDYIKHRIRHTEARANAIMKLVIILMGLYCILGGFIVQNFNSILQSMWTITSINIGAVVGIFMLGMFVPRANSKVAVTSIVFSIVAMLWIVAKAQLSINAGHIKYEVLPNSLDQCEARGLHSILAAINGSTITTTTTTAVPPGMPPPLVTGSSSSNRDFSIYEISFYWYKMLGVVFIFLWAIPMSYVWRPDKNTKTNPKLFSPIVRKFLSLPAAEQELEELPLKAKELKININEKENDEIKSSCP